jgi:hypothetical protein
MSKIHRRHIFVGKQTHPCNAQRISKRKYVDVSVIGGRRKLLPREISIALLNGETEKSADAIVAGSNEPPLDRRMVSQTSEGLNVKLFQML